MSVRGRDANGRSARAQAFRDISGWHLQAQSSRLEISNDAAKEQGFLFDTTQKIMDQPSPLKDLPRGQLEKILCVRLKNSAGSREKKLLILAFR